MSNRNFHIVANKARNEHKYAIDPRHEQPPHGDFPWDYTPKPLKAEGNDLVYHILTAFGVSFVGGIIIMLSMLGLGWL